MEIQQLFQEYIPQKKKVFAQFCKKNKQDVSNVFLRMIKSMKRRIKDKKILNMFFIELYDILYQDILLGKITIAKKVVKLFEILALPMKYIGEKKWFETLKKLMQLQL